MTSGCRSDKVRPLHGSAESLVSRCLVSTAWSGGPPEVGGRSLCDSGKTAFAAGAEGPLNGLVGDPQGVADIFLGQLCFSKAGVNLGNIK